ncbi:FG-GAP repeat protein [Streptomyces mirabilis]|uniref:FG-GAP repeat protein n=1 Tax=Streptomyces mirabilis TaxID=68239 RepID=UPI0036EB2C3B
MPGRAALAEAVGRLRDRPGGQLIGSTGRDAVRVALATAWGDIDDDGYADLAVGAPGEDDASGNADRGSVTVPYGGLSQAEVCGRAQPGTPTGAHLGQTLTP